MLQERFGVYLAVNVSANQTHLDATLIHSIVIILVDANYALNLQKINAPTNKHGMQTNVNVKQMQLQYANLQLEAVKQKFGMTKHVNAHVPLFISHASQIQYTIRILVYAKNVQRLLRARLDFKFGIIPHVIVYAHQELLHVTVEQSIINLLAIVKNATFQLKVVV